MLSLEINCRIFLKPAENSYYGHALSFAIFGSSRKQ